MTDLADRHTTLLLEILQRLSVVETQTAAILVEQGRWSERRREIYVSLEDVRRGLGAVAGDVAEMKPIVTELERRRLMFDGGSRMARALGKGAHGLSAAFGGALVWGLQHLFGKGP